jgi:hypothetical protein
MKSQYSERAAIFSGHIAVCLAVLIWCLLIAPAGSKVAGQDCDYSGIGESLGPFEAKLSGACTRGAFNGGRTI